MAPEAGSRVMWTADVAGQATPARTPWHDDLDQLAQAHTALATSSTRKDAPAFRLQLAKLTDAAAHLHGFYAALTPSR